MNEYEILQQISERFDKAAILVELRHKESLRPVEVEALYGYSRQTLAHWRVHGKGPRFIKDGKLILYRQKDLQAYQEQFLTKTRDQR